MSYARFSSDDWQSDVYAYESDWGFEVHLAANRVPMDTSSLPPWVPPSKENEGSFEAFVARHKQVNQMLHNNEHLREPIDLPGAGESFCYETPGECAIALLEFRALGYFVPSGCIEELQEDEHERVSGQQDQTRDDVGLGTAPETE